MIKQISSLSLLSDDPCDCFPSFDFLLDICVKIVLIFPSNQFFPFVFALFAECGYGLCKYSPATVSHFVKPLILSWYQLPLVCIVLHHCDLICFLCLLIVFVNASMSEIVGAGTVSHSISSVWNAYLIPPKAELGQ